MESEVVQDDIESLEQGLDDFSPGETRFEGSETFHAGAIVGGQRAARLNVIVVAVSAGAFLILIGILLLGLHFSVQAHSAAHNRTTTRTTTRLATPNPKPVAKDEAAPMRAQRVQAMGKKQTMVRNR